MRSTIYVDNQWRTIPPAGGMIPGTTLHATYLRDEKDGFKFVRIALCNQGSQPVKLGSCHVIELDVLQGLKKGDRVYLDSGGGWPCGCIDVTGSILTPSYKYEFWKELFLGSEDIAWARQVMQEDDLESGVPGANYSFGGVSAIELADRGEVFATIQSIKEDWQEGFKVSAIGCIVGLLLNCFAAVLYVFNVLSSILGIFSVFTK